MSDAGCRGSISRAQTRIRIADDDGIYFFARTGFQCIALFSWLPPGTIHVALHLRFESDEEAL